MTDEKKILGRFESSFDFARVLERRGSLGLREQVDALELLEALGRDAARRGDGESEARIAGFIARVLAEGRSLAESTLLWNSGLTKGDG